MSGTQDAHKGGDLSQMAKDGTKVPMDAGTSSAQLPSVANPSQQKLNENQMGATTLNRAADNPAGESKYADDAITASGHSIAPDAFTKHSGHGGKEANH